MFQNNSNDSSSKKSTFDQANARNPVIHTMKDDLENSGNLNSEKEVRDFTGPKAENGASPFLSQENWGKKEKKVLEAEHKGLGKAIVFAIIISIVLTVGAGGYYFWMTRMSTGESSENIEIPESIPNSVVSSTENPQSGMEMLPAFSASQPNYLVVNTEAFNAAGIKKLLAENAAKVAEAQIVSPVEFIVTDNENNPVPFIDFTQKVGLGFKPDVLDQLENNFSLYIYNDNKNTRLGLAASSKNDGQLRTALLGQENNLTRALEFLYLGLPYNPEDATFNSSNYDGKAVRYSNIKSSEDLSLDYAVYNSQLIIGTTKMTLRSILDYIGQQGESGDENEITDQL